VRDGVRATLLADGLRDRILTHVVEWVLREAGLRAHVQFAKLDVLPYPPKELLAKARTAMELWPAELLFVHRDAERAARAERSAEISKALGGLGHIHVQVIPVRMTEAWFLFDEPAIRRAAGNPNGTTELKLPSLDEIERIPDPKERLHEALRTASGLSSRRLARFNPGKAVNEVAMLIDSFAPLRSLPAFSWFERETKRACGRSG
jgi:hypothetical protein